MPYVDVMPLQREDNLLLLPGEKPLSISDDDMARVMDMVGDQQVGRMLQFEASPDGVHIRISVVVS